MGSNSNRNWWNNDESFFPLNSPERNRPSEVGAIGNDRLTQSLTDLSQYFPEIETDGGGGGGGNGQNPADPDNNEFQFMQPANPSTSKSITVTTRRNSTINGIPIPFTNRTSSDTIGNEAEQSQMSEEILAALKSSKNILLECPPGLNRQLQILRILLDYWNWRKNDETENRPLSSKRVKNDKCDQEEKENSPNPSKIIFCCNDTSENSVISNFRENVSNLEERLNNITVVVLNGSHQLECVYRDGIVEELLTFDLVQECGLLICPQEVIISPPNRATFGISQLNGAIIVFDDGYNLEETSKNELSVEIFPDEFNTFLEILRGDGLELENLAGDNGDFTRLKNHLIDAIPTLVAWIQSHRIFVYREDIRDQLNIFLPNADFPHINFQLEQLSRKLFEHMQFMDNPVDLEAVRHCQKFLHILPIINEDDINFSMKIPNYPNRLNPYPTRPGNALKISCANSSILMRPIGDAAMSVIASGSCITPYSSWDCDLDNDDEHDEPSPSGIGIVFHETIKIYDGDEITREKFLFTSTTVGPSGTVLNLNQNSRSNCPVQLEIFESLKKICDTVPGPILALFHSESLLQTLMERRKRESPEYTSLEIQLNRQRIICELDIGVHETPEEFLERKLNVRDNNGKVVFALLHRGKFYPDNLDIIVEKLREAGISQHLRTIVHVSVPYGAREHLDHFIAKDEYYENLKETRGQGQGKNIDGKGWYRREAFRVFSQSFRFVQSQRRNSKDWAMVIVLDSRLIGRQGDFWDFIPYWVQQCKTEHFHEGNEENEGFEGMMGLIAELAYLN